MKMELDTSQRDKMRSNEHRLQHKKLQLNVEKKYFHLECGQILGDKPKEVCDFRPQRQPKLTWAS